MSPEFETELRVVCRAAGQRARGRIGNTLERGVFHLEDFQEAFKADLKVRRRPTVSACRDLLASLPFVQVFECGWYRYRGRT